MSKLVEIKKTNYYYKMKNGTFKNLYAFKYAYPKTLKKKLRKHFYRFKISNNKTAKTYHGKFYRKKDIIKSRKKTRKGKGKDRTSDIIEALSGTTLPNELTTMIATITAIKEFELYQNKLNSIYKCVIVENADDNDIIRKLKIINAKINNNIELTLLERCDITLYPYYEDLNKLKYKDLEKPNFKKKSSKAFDKLIQRLRNDTFFTSDEISRLKDPNK